VESIVGWLGYTYCHSVAITPLPVLHVETSPSTTLIYSFVTIFSLASHGRDTPAYHSGWVGPTRKKVQYLTGCPRPLTNGMSKAVIRDSNFIPDSHCGRILGRSMYAVLKLVHWNLVVLMRCTANLFCVASFPGSPLMRRWWKISGGGGRTWYSFICDVTAQQRLGFNELIGYITTRVCWLLCQQQTNRGKIIPMAMTAEKITLWHRQLRILVQSNWSYKMRLTCFRLSGDENQFLQTDGHHLLHSLVFHFNKPRLVALSFMHQKLQSNWTWLLHGLHVTQTKIAFRILQAIHALD